MSFDLDDPKLTAYALGQLDEADHAEVEAQLANDPAARAVVEQTRTAADRLQLALASEQLIELAATNAVADQQRIAGNRARRAVFYRWAFAAVSACMIVALGVSLLLPSLNRARETASSQQLASYTDNTASNQPTGTPAQAQATPATARPTVKAVAPAPLTV